MPLTLRPAQADDGPWIVELNRRLALETEGKSLDNATLTRGVAAALADPTRGRYFLAERDGVVVVQLMLTAEWSDWRDGWLWWIQSVYVVAEARRQGVFRALFEHVSAQARADATVIGLRLYVEAGNHAARQTYDRLGLRPAGYLMLEKYPL